MYLKERLAAGEYLIGAGIYSGSTDMIEYTASGMDWIWWEAQHVQSGWQTLLHGVRTGQLMDIPVLVRSWTHDGGTIERLLDMGADGIIVPMVNTVEQAHEIVSHCYYPPLGNRSFGSLRAERIEEDPDQWNKRMLVVVQLETAQALENMEQIARVPGIDVLHIGTRDLALRMGKHSDDLGARVEVQEQRRLLLEICKKTRKSAMAIPSTPAVLRECISDGFQMICAGMDVDFVQANFQQMRKTFRQRLSELDKSAR